MFGQEITADLPANSKFLSPRLFMNNGATAAAVACDCSRVVGAEPTPEPAAVPQHHAEQPDLAQDAGLSSELDLELGKIHLSLSTRCRLKASFELPRHRGADQPEVFRRRGIRSVIPIVLISRCNPITLHLDVCFIHAPGTMCRSLFCDAHWRRSEGSTW